MTFNSFFKRVAIGAWLIATATAAAAQGWPAGYGGVMLQGFSWDSYANSQWTKLQSMADDLDGSFDLLWIPNAGNCGNGNQMGYAPKYWFPVGTNYTGSFGTLAELRAMVATMSSHNIGIIGDVVINHRANVSNWTDFASETYNGTTYRLTASDICGDDDGGETANHLQSGEHLGNADTGDGWNGMRDLDHTSANVQTNVKAYLAMLLNDLNYTGFRYDMAAGYAPAYIKTYNNHAQPQFSVGECWKTASEIKTWLDGTKDNGTPTSAAFDFQFRYTVRNAINANDWTKLNQANTGSQGYPLISNSFESGNYKRWAVTFVENHDTQDRGSVSGYNKDPIVRDTLAANAFMLAMPGTPCVFLPHLLDYKKDIKNMIAARKAAGVTNTSAYSVSNSQTARFLTSTTGTKTRLICAVGPGADTYAGPNNSVTILAGYHYKYFMPNSTNIAWPDIPSGTYNGTIDVKLTAVSANYTTLVYTLDGTTPTAASNRVASGSTVSIDADATLTVALLNGNSIVSGSTATRHYKVQQTKKFTVYLKDPGWTNVYFKIFQASDGNNDAATYGVNVNANTTMIHGQKFYYRTFESTDLDYHFNMLFCDGSWGNDHQTANINNVSADVYYEITGGGGNSRLTVTDITAQCTGAYTATVYFKDPGWGSVYYYAWDTNGQILGDWPGQQVTQTTTIDGDTYYCLPFAMQNDETPINVIFTNNAGTQTVDVTGITGDVYYVCDHATDDQGHFYVLNRGQKSVSVFFQDPTAVVSDWTDVSYYVWNSSGNLLGSWPGTQVTAQRVVGGDTYYYHRFVLDEAATINVIFNNAATGGSSTKQTTNIEGVAQDTYYRVTGATSDGKYLWETVTPSAFEPYVVTVFFKQPETGWDAVSFHAWGTGTVTNADGTTLNDSWPGRAGNLTYIDGEPWYSRSFVIATDGAAVNTVINNNNHGSQTVDITGINHDVYYELGNKNGENKYEVNNAGDMTEVITGITLNYNTFNLGIHATQQLVATVTGSHVTTPVTWTSSNENIVTVTNGAVAPARTGQRRAATMAGLIYGVAGGTATVTATTGDYSAACLVTVDPTTGLLTVDSAEPRVTARGRLIVIDSPVDTVAWLSTPDGRSRRVVVHAGVNEFEVSGPITFVSIDGKVHSLLNR